MKNSGLSKWIIGACAAVALLAITNAAWACAGCGCAAKKAKKAEVKAAKADVELCTKCGEIKGKDACCTADSTYIKFPNKF